MNKTGIWSFSLAVAALLGVSPIRAQTPSVQFTWNYADIEPAGTLRTRNVEWWIAELEKRSNGTIKIQRYWAGAMVGGKDVPVGVAKGYPELGSYVYVYDMSFVRVLSLFDLPISKTAVGAIRAFNDMVLHNDIMKAELRKRKLIALTVFGHHGDSMAMTAKNVTGSADLKGLRMRSPGGLKARIFQALGAEVVTMGPADVYTALQRGTIDGVTSSLKDIDEWKWTDYGKFVWSLGIPIGPAVVYVINEDVWNGVPAAMQKMILDTSAEFLERQIKDYEESLTVIQARMKEKGVSLTSRVASITAVSEAVSDKEIERWVADMDKAGLPGKALLATYRDVLKKYE